MDWLQNILAVIFDVSRYNRLTDRERARTVYIISGGMLVLGTALTFVAINAQTGQNLWQRAAHEAQIAFPLLFFYTLNIAAYLLARFGRLNAGAVVVTFAWTLSFGAAIVPSGMYTPIAGIILAVTLLLPALLLNMPGLALGVALAAVLYGAGLAVRQNAPLPDFSNPISELIPTLFTLAILVNLAFAFLRFARLTREESALQAAEGRFILSEITSQITRRISSRLGLDEVLNEAIHYIISNYPDIYHAQIFLVDDTGKRARLEASTGEPGRQLLALQHSLDVGSQSVIGQVTASGQPMIARARTMGSVHRPNEYLPDTKVEAAFPLIIGDKVIGALDLQSTGYWAFPDTDLPIFQTLADHIAIAIDNARLFEQTEQRLKENQQLAEQSQEALRRVEQLNRRLTGLAWSEYLGSSRLESGLDVDFDSGAARPALDWTPDLEAAARDNTIIERESDGQRVLVVPVQVRGVAIGAIEFELDADSELTTEDRQLIAEVSERFGLAAENARLFSESQRIAQREALINEVGARLQASSNVETTLTQAARSLQQMLKAERVSIRLGEPPAANGSGKDVAR